MKNTKILIAPQEKRGEFRNILGINNSTQINDYFLLPERKRLFDELGAKFVRHHDATFENPGYALIDVSRIFPLFHADVDDPKNYIFGPTDDYLRLIPEDMIIEFRFGESIEHAVNRYRIIPPADYDRWADICIHIMRHLTEGWADGLHLNIQYLSFYEEPNDNFEKIFGAPFDEYLKLYVIAHKKLRAAFPHMKIGGPATGYHYDINTCERFLTCLQENGIKPDFISGDIYDRNVDLIPEKVREVQALLERFDCQDTEIFVTEWHLGPAKWRPFHPKGFFDAEGAAFSASTLIRLMDTKITGAYYYCWGLGNWGLVYVDPAEGVMKGYPTYYALKYFTELTKCEARVSVTTEGKEDPVDLLAGITGDGKVQLLVSCYNAEVCHFEISVPAYANARIKKIVSREKEKEEVWMPLDKNGDAFSLTLEDDGCAVYFIEFEK